ncbi:PIN/TRAM domain-containing protein [Occallatibacter riparius]|uniref:TRAM domain-containing protein n=1 Tax=Occallatibacter riparius TaxID=1002689 RepID=A0A9J7BR80_9BACT|nr:TRAM domain-containing protein [Occallatibacter riparius]UWZ84258.1 TRAM domain-containing protein [Occallatibacter riparius]
MDLILLRVLFVVLLSVVCYFLRPFGLTAWQGALAGGFAAGAVIVFEFRVRALSLRRLIGAVFGSVLGIFGAALFCLVLRSAELTKDTSAVLQIFVLLLMTYIGLLVGANKGDLLNPAALGTFFNTDRPAKRSAKVLDTSVIIDGRIADIAEAGFIDGVMVIPEFVLRELQVVADSTDSSKRQRGRRGLDMLQRMQGNANLQVQIVSEDFPTIREVDLKLLELAKKWEAKVVTNDFNLNKVAHLHHVEVLNINDLANALKPVVLPGERMTVLILKEGKEYNQGVGYLDDGTMVVVDHARKMIGRSVDISVTSVLQTASGKMIFGKMDDNPKSGDAPRTTPVELTR